MSAAVVIDLVAAFGLGALIGVERQWRQRIAGIRTNALVSVGAAMFVTLAELVTHETSATRIAAQVVSGIGFLGAGVIIRDGLNVRGVNTAATLWCAAGVGVLAGSGFAGIAAVGVALVLAANLGLRSLAWRLDRKGGRRADQPVVYVLKVTCRDGAGQRLRARLLAEASALLLRLKSLFSEEAEEAGYVQVTAVLLGRGADEEAVEKVAGIVSLDEDVVAVRWEAAMDLEDEAEVRELGVEAARRRLRG